MKKKYILTIFTLVCCVVSAYTQDVTFNVDLNGSNYPTSANHIIRITANPNAEGWNGNFVTLTDDNSDGIYSGTATGVSAGTLLFQVREGDPGSTNWGTPIVPSGCNANEFDGSNYKVTVSGNLTLNFKIGECITPIPGADITFNVDLNGTSFPEAGKEIRIGGNAAGTGWTPDIVTLSDDNNDGIYTGTATDLPVGDLLFRVFQGTIGTPGWASGDWIDDIKANGCSLDESSEGGNYKTTVVDGVNQTISFKFNECISAPTLGNIQFNIDFNGSSHPASANHIIRIAAKPNGGSWNGNFTELSDGNNDGIFSAIVYGVEPGEILFQVLEGEPGSTNWGTPISDPVGCNVSEYEAGNYKATITIAETNTLNFKLDNCISASLSNNSLEINNAFIYPNPVENFINIKTDLTVNALTIYNLRGQKVLETKSYVSQTGLDVSKIKSGIYFLKLNTDNQGFKVVKFIKK